MQHICEQCGQEFQAPPSQGARFCDRDCYDKFRRGVYKCDFCGKTFERFKSRAKRYKGNFCSPDCSEKFHKRENHQRWNGGESKSNGYVYIYKPKHPQAVNKRVKRARLKMEKHLNRVLKPEEIVHHRNGDKTDDSIENLVITTRKEHPNLHPEVGFQKGHKPHPRPSYGGK